MTESLAHALQRVRALRSLSAAAAHDFDSADAVATLLDAARELTGSALVGMLGADGERRSAGQRGDAEGSATGLFAEAAAWASGRAAGDPRVVLRRAGTTVFVAPETPDPRLDALVFDRAGKRAYSVLDLELIESVLATAAVMLALSRRIEEETELARIDTEHAMASRIAQATLAGELPALPGVELFARSVPARRAGGDFYAFGTEGGLLHFAVGDVAGKGLPAAIVMGRMVTACHVAFRGVTDPDARADGVAAAYAAVEDELASYLGEINRFVTLTIGSYDPRQGTVRLCNAGHSPVLLGHGDEFTTVHASAPPLGVPFVDTRPRVERLDLDPGDALYLGSDGLVDQDDGAGHVLGYDGFTRLCAATAHGSAVERGDAIFGAVEHRGVEATDDRTLVILRRAAA